ncbi:uncharacterized protein [Triticum aestivum]|uniref:uncharacterized protein isoform X2 n=1 Tax=Triticum aestivum TaxID=4565 RepID=UPI001D0198D0|nr:uncharacterized protein LOC123088250 isoform X2 [Triticum aestivum]
MATTGATTGAPPSSSRRVGGRFWALADADEDDADGDADATPASPPSRVGLHVGEKKEMIRRVVHRRTAAIRPWKGPLPKVIF